MRYSWLFLFCLLMSCDSNGETEEARYRWRSFALSDYTVLQTRSCECLPPARYRLVVENNHVVDVIDPETGQTFAVENLDWYWTIDQLFDRLETWESEDPAVFRVQYHPQMGYPTDIYIDLDEDVADEEIIMTLSDLDFTQ